MLHMSSIHKSYSLWAFLLFIAMCLTSCASSNNPSRNIIAPFITITPTADYNADYQIIFKNYENNDDYNIHVKEVRRELLDDAIHEYCSGDYKIEHEEFVKEGLLTPNGRNHNYYIYVSCD